MRIGKTYRFEAAHHLPNHKGKCSKPHGHSYELEVEVESDELMPVGSSDGGMVMDFADLDEIVEELVEALDHTDLNLVAHSYLPGVVRTTAELLCAGIVAWVRAALEDSHIRLSRVRLWETEKCYAEWTVGKE